MTTCAEVDNASGRRPSDVMRKRELVAKNEREEQN
jgi:hypothetical protein